MNKRDFLLGSVKIAAVASISTVGIISAVRAQALQGYQLVNPPLNTRSIDKIEVLEYFWFGCPHCFAFEPSINKWIEEKPDYVDFVREAPPLNPGWEPHSRAFYAAKIMGVTEQFFEPMFNAIHLDRRSLRSPDNIAKFSGELDIDAKKFRKTMDSFAVDTRMKKAMQMARASRISGVPSVVINGKYLTGGSLAGSHEGILRVIDERVAEEYAQL
ncbi:MAG: thiol:disulfide interchange protein DsbA [Granulosicoccus sp.]|jgi:thiol:disulfide interchange protein DsbA